MSTDSVVISRKIHCVKQLVLRKRGYGPDIHYVEYVKRCVSCNANLGKTRPGRRLW